MSQHGCPERLSSRSKGFQEDGSSQPTMEVLVETLTGTAFEMTVSPSDTIFAIKSKICRVEGIPVSQQHLVYNLRELEDAWSLRALGIQDGARLRLVLGMRGGPISTRRLPPPPGEPWRDIERLLDSNRDDDWSTGSGSGSPGGSGCRVTVVVFREGERVNMVRVRENKDGTYSPIDHAKYSSSLSHLEESEYTREESNPVTNVGPVGSGGATHNARTAGKVADLRRRMDALALRKTVNRRAADKPEIQKTRSEETLVRSVDESGAYTPYELDEFALYDGSYARYEYDCSYDRYTLLPPEAAPEQTEPDRLKFSEALAGSILVQGRPEEEAILEECLDGVEQCRLRDSPQMNKLYGPVVGGSWWWSSPSRAHSVSASALPARAPPPPRPRPPLADALFSSSTSDLEALKRNRLLPALSRHRNTEHLHLSDSSLHVFPRAEPPPKEKKRSRCALCRKKLSIATVHRCRCGAQFCAPHRYAEVHGCAYDYKAQAHTYLHRDNPLVSAPKLPKI